MWRAAYTQAAKPLKNLEGKLGHIWIFIFGKHMYRAGQKQKKIAKKSRINSQGSG